MTIETISRNRPRVWEDEAPVEPRPRRVQQSVPPTVRPLPGELPETADAEDDGFVRPAPGGLDGQRPSRSHQERPRRPWWRPASKAGRIFLSLVLLIVLSGFGASAYLFKTYLSRDGRFRIAGASNIEASGLSEVSRAQMLPVFGEDIGRNIFFVPLNERRKELEEIPWVERATVMRLLPDQIRVQVVERQPIAFVRQGQQIGLVDANGVLLTMPAAMMAQHHYSFPVVTGIIAGDPLAARKMRMAVYQRLLSELDSNGQHVSEQISEIDLTDPEDAQILMPEQGGDVLIHFGDESFLERYQRYKAHIAEWRQQYPKLSGVDLRYDQKVVLEMASGTDVAQAAATEQAAADSDEGQAANAQAADHGKPASGSALKQPSAAKTAPSRLQAPAKLKPGKPASKAAAGTKQTAAQKKAKAMKATAAKTRMAKEEKKRVEAKRAVLNTNRQKTAPTAVPVETTGQAQ